MIFLLKLLINYILEALTTLHSNGIIHGNPHYKNIMLSGYDKNFWKKFESKNVSQEISKEFVKKLQYGGIRIKFIDFGLSTTRERVIGNLRSQVTDFITIRELLQDWKILNVSLNNTGNLFDALAFYDITNMLVFLHYTGRGNLLPKVIAKQTEIFRLTGVRCMIGKLYE